MNIKNIIFGIGNTINNTYVKLVRQSFDVNNEWFSKIHTKHYTSDIQSKFDTELFVDQGVGEEIFEFIAKPDIYYSHLLKELKILSNWIADFLDSYQALQKLLSNQAISINENSRQFIQLEVLKSRSDEFLDQITQNIDKLETQELERINTLVQLDNTGLDVARAFKLDKIDEYKLEDQFISVIPTQSEEDRFSVEIVFRRLSQIVNQIRSVNTLLININIRVQFIYGNAGMGKSNFTAYLTTKLIKEESPVVFIKARSFKGDPDQFERILMELLEIPDNYRLSEVLEKLNSFGERRGKRVILIFDGLNETSYGTNGFSPIWRRNLDDFLEQLKFYPNLFFVATLRTSYIERIWNNNVIPYKSQELIGFNNQVSLLEVVERYFNHYRIRFNSPDQSDIFYFQTPLLLDLYCKMLNPNKEEVVDPVFGLEGFVTVFERYIRNLSEKIRTDLGLLSAEIVSNGIERCSVEFMNGMGAFLPIISYYSCVEGRDLTTINNTVAHSVLEEYLIYLKDSFNNEDVVVHTHQEVGGYLLATALLKQHNNDIHKVVDGGFFRNHVVGVADEQHQLADDILKFLVVLSGEYQFLIEKYGDIPSVKDYLWIKLQREEVNAENLKLRNILSDQVVSKDDILKLLEKSKPTLFNPNSSLNFLLTKSDISKLKKFDFEVTWPRYIYQNFAFFSDFLKLRFEELKKTGQLEISLDVTIWLLESTSHNMRDEATKKLLEYGVANPSYIFSKVVEYSTSGRTYLYERLAGVAYGVCLRKQSDQDFVNNELNEYAETVYNLQFNTEPAAPSFHYIVVDSFKHIVDLAIHLKVFEVPENENERFSAYKFIPEIEWQQVTDEEINNVSLEWKGYPDPDPLSGDFVTYTIPRLLDSKEEGYVEAVAHIYKRIINTGYQPDAYKEMPDGVERDFYSGVKQYSMDGKIDRLGKKYCWNAFFEYAGHLLNTGQLPAWYEGDTSVSRFYKRLGDVEIEVSNPSKSVKEERLYFTELLKEKSNSPEWTYIEQFESLNEVIDHKFDSKEFTLLYGYYVESEKSKHSYNVRSFLLVEAFLVKKKDVEGKKGQIDNRTLDWDHDVHIGGTITKTYFGELYWADTIPTMESQHESIPSTEMQEIDHRVIPDGLSLLEKYHAKEQAVKGKEMAPVQIPLSTEPAIVEYLWESDSEIYSSLRGNIPSPNIGKHLNLKSDPTNFQILDENGERAFVSVEFEEREILKQESDYIRTDLLKKYLDDKGLVLMYQIKQHTFDRNAGDGSGDFRGLQFRIKEL